MKKSAINQIGINNCTGCYACYNICEYNAIKMNMTEDGFYKPYIAVDKCIDCAACASKCPVLHTEFNNIEEPTFFMAWSNDKEIRSSSSSGGIFSEIAQSIIKNNGDVYGVVWDGNLELCHTKASTIEDLPDLRGSKYLQSKVNDVYKEISNTLSETKKQVLFVGTPCQVAGIKKVINNERLITCDLLCHGIPSYIPFKSYVNSMEDEITKVNFRDKLSGWTSFSLSFIGRGTVKSIIHTNDRFFMGFLKNFYLNEACYNCKFSKLPRQGDITLGDFWGIDKKYDQNNEGVSVVIANNTRGYELMEYLQKSDVCNVKKMDRSIASKYNTRIYSGLLLRPKQRDYIINDIKKHGFKKVADNEIQIPGKFEAQISRIASYLKQIFKSYSN